MFELFLMARLKSNLFAKWNRIFVRDLTVSARHHCAYLKIARLNQIIGNTIIL